MVARDAFLTRLLALALLALFVSSLRAQNIVPNPEFQGNAGLNLPLGTGVVNSPQGVPDSWRAFAVGGSIDLEIVPLFEDEIFPGSPATNAVLLRVNVFGGDQGFDDDNGRFDLIPNVDYRGEFYVKTGNFDETDQSFNFGFPLFRAGTYLGREPGGMGGVVATSEWQLITGPTFRDTDTDEGHISWRCVGDDGEDAILIALPSVERVGDEPLPPSSLTCVRRGADVELSWQNNSDYDALTIWRDAAVLAELAGDATSYLDEGIAEGTHTYQVIAEAPGLEAGPSCEVRYVILAPGASVSVDLGDIDTEDGMVNSQRQDPSDGENEFVICGPVGEEREVRSNWAGSDPTPDDPDGFFYFNVTDPDMKAQESFVLKATVYDDMMLGGTILNLQYTNAQATSAQDFPNTFYPLENPPAVTLEGTDGWVELTWKIENAGFRSFQQGSSDFRIGVGAGARICLDRVELVYMPFVTDLACRKVAAGVELTWQNGAAYDELRILRDDLLIEELEGDATSFLDEDVEEGTHVYEVVAVIGETEIPTSCEVTVYFVDPGTKVSVDLGEFDLEDGLANSQRQDGGDGENEAAECGPAGDLRDSRTNLSNLDNDDPDLLFYFVVTDPAMKAQTDFRLRATVYDDASLAGVGLFVQYTNSASTGPADIDNTFFPQEEQETHILDGTGEWVTLEWTIADAGFRSFQQGTSDFRIGVMGTHQVCMDLVELIYGEEGPTDPVFLRGDANNDGDINLSDAIYKLGYLYLGGPAPPCFDAADANDDGELNITGAINLLSWLYLGGPPPPDPGPALPCGPDPTPDQYINADCVYNPVNCEP
ncbi:MAG: hypothetical protein JXA90_05475 [Planctomycetes bacterium]|nr:hypothetical protein [Planctomycetota bacterium]